MGPLKQKAEKLTMDASVVAKMSIDGMYACKPEVIPGFVNWTTAKLVQLLPKVLPELIAKNIYKTDK